MSGLFAGNRHSSLIDFKVEFGRLYDDNGDLRMRVVLADEISPGQLPFVGFGHTPTKSSTKIASVSDLGGLTDAYREVARRLGVLPEGGASGLSDLG